MLRILNILLLTLMSLHLVAQSTSCKDRLRDVNHDMAKHTFPEGKEVYRLKYSMTSTGWKSGADNRVEEVDMLLSKEVIKYTTDNIDVFQDEHDVFMVVKPRKSIMRDYSVQYADKQKQMADVVNKRDTLLLFTQETGCVNVMVDGESIQRVTLKPKGVNGEKYLKHIESVTVTFDYNTNWIEKVVLNYNKKYQFKKMVIQYDEVSYNSKQKLLSSAAEYVLDRNNKLKKNYTGYTYVDER